MKKCPCILLVLSLSLSLHISSAQALDNTSVRERVKFNHEWKFALGHATDPKQDFNHGTAYFSYYAKTGYGDGPAARNFDDRPWRIVDLPHDWCVELPFTADGGHSHGYRAIGINYPGNSVGWYRKKFNIPNEDLGKKISIEFDGVHRNSKVWVNGFYLGTQASGYASFAYDITDYLNYGGENVIAVRVDASMEEGWYYEGAGIVRSVWLLKTSPLHVDRYGTFVTTDLQGNEAEIRIRTTLRNDDNERVDFSISELILDTKNKVLASGVHKNITLGPFQTQEFISNYRIQDPRLWSPEDPNLNRLVTDIYIHDQHVDQYETTFGIRTVRFNPDSGFFLNNKPVKILGTNLHQDHAGVGRAIPPQLHEYRISQLKKMGSNGVRTSHDPPDPAFLDACDRLGFLVLDENRLMGINREHLDLLENLIKRDRNHPSVIIWSLGNEEWAIEGNITGARIATTMQNFANRLDSSRAFTAACSGGWDTGIGMVTQVMGYNYIRQGNIDIHHAKFPWQAGIGTEESNTIGTRGIYVTDRDNAHLAYVNNGLFNDRAETGWKYYNERLFLSGLFYWTGLDYRGEPTPYAWPAVASQFGIMDLCGFPKDIYYYMKAWWGKEDMVHIFPHWNWEGHEGDTIPVIVFSNGEKVELFLNGASLGKKALPENGHLRWDVAYVPGQLEARGFIKGELRETVTRVTTGEPASLRLSSDRYSLKADGSDVAVVTISVHDSYGNLHPTANVDVKFELVGPGRIIGVGNGNPSSHEPEQYFSTITSVPINDLKELPVNSLENRKEVNPEYDDSNWIPSFSKKNENWQDYTDTLLVVRGYFTLPEITDELTVTLFSKSIVENQDIYINGKPVAKNIVRDSPGQAYILDNAILKEGRNEYAVTGQRFRLKHRWDEPNTDPGVIQTVYPAENWKQKTFNGLAQLIIQTEDKDGIIKLKASSEGLTQAEMILDSK